MKTAHFQHGQALTEIVLLLPIMLLLFFAAIQYFHVMERSQRTRMAVHYASRAHTFTHSTGMKEAQIIENVKKEIFATSATGADVSVKFESQSFGENAGTVAVSTLNVVLQVAGFPSSPSYRKVKVESTVPDLFPMVPHQVKPWSNGKEIKVNAAANYLRPGI